MAISTPSARPKARIAAVLLCLVLLPIGCCALRGGYDFKAKEMDIFTPQRLRLTAEYCRIHYGIDSSELKSPRMIVLHFTAFPTLEESYRFFLPVLLDTHSRQDISSGGRVNVSAHYLVDRDGSVYQLASEKVICRHIIGFNYTAIAIENVGRGSEDLTEAQAQSDAALVNRIKKCNPSIEYLIGHQEYQDSWRPHFSLFLEKDPSYHFTPKKDPGDTFLRRVRSLLKESYGLVFKD